jgi:hypothetical protein
MSHVGTGVLRPRSVKATDVLHVGKESNRLAEEPLPSDDESEAVVEYPPRHCAGCCQAVSGRRKRCSDACRKRVARRLRPSSAPQLHRDEYIEGLA